MGVLERAPENTAAVQTGPQRWVILGAACVLQAALGSVYVWSIFAAALGPGSSSTMQLSAGRAMEPFEAALGMIGFGASLGGRLQDRFGPRLVALGGGGLYAGGVLLASFARRPDQYTYLLAGYGIVGGLGLGIAYVVPTAMLQRWFPDRRAMATGCAVAGFGFGGVLTSAVAYPIVAHHPTEPAAAFAPLGLLYLVMVLVGGATFSNPPATSNNPCDGMTLGAAVRTPHFYLLTLVLCANVVVTVAFIATAAGGARALAGATPSQGAALVAVIAIANGAGRVVWAAASERIGRLSAFIVMFTLEACCCYAAGLIHSIVVFYLASILIGLCCGGGFGVMPATAVDYYGLRHAGGIYGRMLFGWSIGGIVGPRWVSLMIDQPTANAYTSAYICLGMAASVAILPAAITIKMRAPGPTTQRRNEVLLDVPGASEPTPAAAPWPPRMVTVAEPKPPVLSCAPRQHGRHRKAPARRRDPQTGGRLAIPTPVRAPATWNLPRWCEDGELRFAPLTVTKAYESDGF